MFFKKAQPTELTGLKELPQPLKAPKGADLIPSDISSTDHLALGMYFHEKDKLDIATYYFSLAMQDNTLGLFMYAISLRHGWGIQSNEEEAVRLLLMASDFMLRETNSSKRSIESLPSEKTSPALVLAIYEIAVSFSQGWGITKDKSKAAYYYELAANLGDADAQMALGNCYLRGDGVKKSKRLAAFWFRKADNQGARMVSMQWIWKPKYD
jgi:TPR repeat protein